MKKSLKLTVAFIVAHLILSSFTVLAINDSLNNTKKVSDTADLEKNELKNLVNSDGSLIEPFSIQIQPQTISFVKNYLDKEGYALEKMKVWGKKYFVIYDDILSANGLPKELKYLSVIESALNKNLVSSAGAVGPWQLMSDEGRRFGLTMNSIYDERTNIKKSTVVACKLLKELYKEFGDWLLVVAAYNGGLTRVKNAIKKNNSSNFWDIQYSLPLETRNHVKRFIATHYAFEGTGGWTTLTLAETLSYKNKISNTKISSSNKNEISSIKIKGSYNAFVIAKLIDVDINKFNKLNPNFNQIVSITNEYSLNLPQAKMLIFENNKMDILTKSIHWNINNSNESSTFNLLSFSKNKK